MFYTLDMFASLKTRHGQASLEYVAVAVFVMAGILIGGPYVVRSINSNFKVLEEGVIDSERETITEGPTNVPLPYCDCSDLIDVGCGDGVTAVNGTVCMPNQKVFRRACAPLGCHMQMIQMNVFASMEECRNDPTNTCCFPTTDGFCGNDPSARGSCRSASGQLRDRLTVCGSPNPITNVTCRADAACTSNCQALGSNASWCSLAQRTFLPSPSYPVTYRNFGGCSSNAFYCEAQCRPNFIIDSRWPLGCCGGGVGGTVINGGPYTATLQADGFDSDGPDCIATPADSSAAYPLEHQVYQTINQVFSNAGVLSAPLTNQNQTDVYASGGADSYWNASSADDVFVAVVSYNMGVVQARFGVYDFGNPASPSWVTPLIGGVGSSVYYTGNGSAGSPYVGGVFTANTRKGFVYNTNTIGRIYSDSTLNSGARLDQLMSFRLPTLAGRTIWINHGGLLKSVVLTADTYLLGLEVSAAVNSDWDYNDMFVLVAQIRPVL